MTSLEDSQMGKLEKIGALKKETMEKMIKNKIVVPKSGLKTIHKEKKDNEQ